MRLTEFYDPEQDQLERRDAQDQRKPIFTLEQLNKLRKYRDIKQAEQAQRADFVKHMYGAPAEGGAELGL